MEGRYVHQKLEQDAQQRARGGTSPANKGKYQQERDGRRQQAMQELEQDISDGDSVVTF